MVNYAIESELRPYLSTDEELVWTGEPQKGVIFRSSDALLIPISFLWGGFAIFWEINVLTTDAPFFFKLWGIPFVLIGIYLIIGRFFIDAKRRSGTVYGITKNRILISSGIFTKEIVSIDIKNLSRIKVNQIGEGRGTITLGSMDSGFSMMQGMDWPGVKQPPMLEFIENAKSVYDKISELQRNA